jgi:hypothetical protein
MPSNDNHSMPEAARILPILGKADPRGAIVLYAAPPRPAPGARIAAVIDFPNDPRET